MKDAKLVDAYVWWVGQSEWMPLLYDGTLNQWPANADITAAFRVKSTGDEPASFRVTFMGFNTDEVGLSPGETTDFRITVSSPPFVGETDHWVLAIAAVPAIVSVYDMLVTYMNWAVAGSPYEPPEVPFPKIDMAGMGGMAIIISIIALVGLAMASRKRAETLKAKVERLAKT